MAVKKRNINLDIIRCAAVFSVVAIHFLLNNGFYSADFIGVRMIFMAGIRTVCNICVPLFLLLTGYLMRRKTFTRSYYKGIIKTLAIYLLASIACLVYKSVFASGGVTVTLKSAIVGLIRFTAAPYSWYIEMYIGLFLIIPFLNACWNGIGEKRKKLFMIVTLLILTSLTSFFNLASFRIPTFWYNLYPVSYYFIGAYFSEYGCKIKKRVSLPFFIFAAAVFTALNSYVSLGGKFKSSPHLSWGSFESVILSVAAFAFMLNLHGEKLPRPIKFVITKVAEWSLGAYLVSWIFDQYAYGILNSRVSPAHMRAEYFFIVVPFVFVCSVLLSGVLNGIYALCEKAVRSVLAAVKKYDKSVDEE